VSTKGSFAGEYETASATAPVLPAATTTRMPRNVRVKECRTIVAAHSYLPKEELYA